MRRRIARVSFLAAAKESAPIGPWNKKHFEFLNNDGGIWRLNRWAIRGFLCRNDAIGRAECKDILWRLLLSSVRPCPRDSQSVRSSPVYCRNSPPVETVCGPRSRSSWKQTPPWSMKWYLLDAMLAQVRRKLLVEAWLAPRVISEPGRRLNSVAK
jgi:hypothetical protein